MHESWLSPGSKTIRHFACGPDLKRYYWIIFNYLKHDIDIVATQEHVLTLRKCLMKYLGMRHQNACNLLSNVKQTKKKKKNQRENKHGARVTVTKSNSPVHVKFFHDKNRRGNIIEWVYVPQIPCRVSGHFPNTHVTNYTKKREHKIKMYNPNQGKWKAWWS